MQASEFLPLIICVLLSSIPHSGRAEPNRPPASIEFRGEDGAVLISEGKIKSYNWSAHTLTLVPGARPALTDSLLKTGQLVSGVPFVVIAEGKPMYKGVFTTSVSSRSFSCPVIVIDSIASKAVAAKDQLSIGLGYPAATFFHGDDPRFDPRIHTALRAAGKLTKGPDDHIQWLAESLREMETIKPGMTRADLLRVFAEEAGLSTRIQRRYAYRDCAFIKVDVKFEPARSPEDKLTEHSEDKIRDISRPFLEWSIQD